MMNKDTEVKKKEQQKPQTKKGGKSVKDKIIKIKESEYANLVEEAVKYKDQYVRLYAEFENARKRMDREKQEFLRYANKELIIEFLGILDNLERCVDSAKSDHQDYTAFVKGIEMVMAHIHEMLKKNDVKPIDVNGKKFDPHYHEVLLQEESDELDDGTVIEELQRGYCIGDKVVRTAKVKVAKQK